MLDIAVWNVSCCEIFVNLRLSSGRLSSR